MLELAEEEEVLFVGKLNSAEWEGEQTAVESQMYKEQTHIDIWTFKNNSSTYSQ